MTGWLVHSFCVECDEYRTTTLHPTLSFKGHPGVSGKLFSYQGESKTLKAWGQQIGISIWGMRDRLKKGWTMEQVMETPKRTHKRPTA
jgi:hypothetical protein